LAKPASTFVPPTIFKLKYHIDMMYRPSIPNNIQHWQVFEDDEQISKFLEMVDEFSETLSTKKTRMISLGSCRKGKIPKSFKMRFLIII
jgi:hypothetical protein